MAFPDYKNAIDEGLPNGFASSRRGEKVRFVVVHVAAGFWDGTIAWFNDPRAQANSHYLVGLDGRVCQFVDEDWAAWTNYPANEESVTIEHVDNLRNGSPGWMSAASFEASAKLTADILKRHGLGVSAIKRHTEVGQTSHQCPGPHFPMDRYEARVAEIMRGVSKPPAKDTSPPATGSLYRVVVGQGEEDLRLAKKRGFDKAWLLGERVVVASGSKGFAVEMRDRAIAKGFKDAWLLSVDADAPETARPPKEEGMPEWVERPHAYLRNCLGGRYVPWVSGRFTAGPPAWVRQEAPPAADVARAGAFCAFALTGALLKNGIPLPEPLDPEWEGGLLDYGRDFIEEQRIAVAYEPGMEIRKMDAFICKFTGDPIEKQGHTWVADEDGKNPRCIQWDGPGGGNNRRTLSETIRLFGHGKTVYLIRREKWLKPKGA